MQNLSLFLPCPRPYCGAEQHTPSQPIKAQENHTRKEARKPKKKRKEISEVFFRCLRKSPTESPLSCFPIILLLLCQEVVLRTLTRTIATKLFHIEFLTTSTAQVYDPDINCCNMSSVRIWVLYLKLQFRLINSNFVIMKYLTNHYHFIQLVLKSFGAVIVTEILMN